MITETNVRYLEGEKHYTITAYRGVIKTINVLTDKVDTSCLMLIKTAKLVR